MADQVERNRAVRILARSLLHHFQSNGYGAKDVIALSTELLHQLIEGLRHRRRVEGSDPTLAPDSTKSGPLLPRQAAKR